jgi:hypothetical protein
MFFSSRRGGEGLSWWVSISNNAQIRKVDREEVVMTTGMAEVEIRAGVVEGWDKG